MSSMCFANFICFNVCKLKKVCVKKPRNRSTGLWIDPLIILPFFHSHQHRHHHRHFHRHKHHHHNHIRSDNSKKNPHDVICFRHTLPPTVPAHADVESLKKNLYCNNPPNHLPAVPLYYHTGSVAIVVPLW